MALIICPDCGKEFSNRAIACPNCGFPTSEIVSDNDGTTVGQPNDNGILLADKA